MLYLTRWADTPFGIFGTLSLHNGKKGFECYTVERNWHNNLPFKSCIPEGEYPLAFTKYQRGGYGTAELMVPKRTRILIHKGNVHTDVSGCIAVGTRLGLLDGMWAVLDSKGAFATLWKHLYFSNEHLGALSHNRIVVRWKSEGQKDDLSVPCVSC